MTGIRRYSEKLISALERTGTPVRVHRIRKIEFSVGGKPAGGLLSQKLFSLLVRTSCPVIHSLSPDVITGRTNVATIHDLIPFHHRETFMRTRRERAGYQLMFGRLEELVLIVQTEFTKNQLVDYGVDKDRIEVCGVGIQDIFRPSVRPSPYPDNGMKHLITVGDFNPRKRFDIIYEAVNAIEGVDLYHIGPVNNWVRRHAELKNIADRSGRIHLMGALPDDRLVDYLSHADLLVHATLEEGAGFTPAEAMACGTKSLVNPIPVYSELYGDNVFYCDLSAEDFSKGIEAALEKEVDRSHLIEAARKFSPDEEARKVASVYSRVAGAGRA